MRGNNPWQVTAIIAIVLVVVLLVPLVILIKDHQTLADREKKALDDFKTKAQEAAKLDGELGTVKALIGVPVETTLDELKKQHVEMMDAVLPGEDETLRTYHGAVDALRADLTKEKDLHGGTRETLAQRESDLQKARNDYDRDLQQLQANLDGVLKNRAADQAEVQRLKEENATKITEAVEQQLATLSKSESEKSALQTQVRLLQNDNQDIREANTFLAEMLTDVRNPNVEHPAGEIISVDQRAGTAIINRGDADGLLVRTMFSVYHSSITGLSFHTVPVESEAVYCDVCKREVSRNVSKASVEVMRILGPHRAEVRILDDILTDPILKGDVVYSPIWKPGQKIRFALTAGMYLPGSSIESGTEAIKMLIERNGGIVDCWIDETVPEGEDHFRGEITDFTNFIVVNAKVARNLEPEVYRVQQGLIESARNKAIKTISLEDLLSRMAWRNMTPVYNSDSPVFMPEMRVVPQHQGTLHQASGAVSPAFTPENANSRLDAQATNSVRGSSGTVSPFFNSNAPPPPSSGGKTSDIFRPRSPVAGEK